MFLQNIGTIMLSYSNDGLTSIKFSREKTLKRTVVNFASTSQIIGKSVMGRTQGLIEKSFDSFPI
jgi:hypothetical protein